MSGDLRDPGRSLPLGTFMAVGLSIVVYVGVAIVFAGVLPADVLGEDYEAMKRVEMAQKELGENQTALEALNRRLNQAESEGKDREVTNQLQAEINRAQEKTDRALRRSGKARARLEAAQKAAEAAGVFEKKPEAPEKENEKTGEAGVKEEEKDEN